MTPADMLTRAVADGVRVTLSQGGLRLSGERQAVRRWVGHIRSRRTEVLELAKRAELSRLLTDLLWDAPEEVEQEALRWAANLEQGLALYRLVYEEYDRLGEIPKSLEDGGWGIPQVSSDKLRGTCCRHES